MNVERIEPNIEYRKETFLTYSRTKQPATTDRNKQNENYMMPKIHKQNPEYENINLSTLI